MKLKGIFKFLLFFGLASVLMYFVFQNTDFNNLWSKIQNANMLWIAISLSFAFLGYISRAFRWKILIEGTGHKPSIKNTIYATISAYFVNILLPRVGEITRCGVLNRTDKVPVDKLLGTVVLERVFDLLVLIIILSGVILAKFDLFGSFFYEIVYLNLKDKISNLFTTSPSFIYASIGVILLSISLLYIFRKRLKTNPLSNKIRKFIKGILTGILSFKHVPNKTGFIIHTIIIWTMYWLMTYVLFFAMQSTIHLSPIDGLFVLVAGGLGMAAPVQNGFGAFHWIVISSLVLFNIDKPDAEAWAIINHESQTVFVFILGSIVSVLLSLQLKSKHHAKQPKNS